MNGLKLLLQQGEWREAWGEHAILYKETPSWLKYINTLIISMICGHLLPNLAFF